MSKLTGTKEWAKKNINLFTGNCENACIYCYAVANNWRFGKAGEQVIKKDLLTHNFRKRDYVTMYPSAHDIRMKDIGYHVQFLKNFLSSGSRLLIVTKADAECTAILGKELYDYRDQVEFRVTIGSANQHVLEFFEPNAPKVWDRLAALTIANSIFKTSLSIEPMLDTSPKKILERFSDFVSGDIWIGKLNRSKYRIIANGYRYKLSRALELVKWQSDDNNILRIVEKLSKYPNVRWKDSIREVIERSNYE